VNRAREDNVIARALRILGRRMREPAERYSIETSWAARDYARLQLAELEREAFVVFYLDSGHRVIAHEQIAIGTLKHVSVPPREIARGALRHNAAAVVLAHNHPSGRALFSEGDERVTEDIRKALGLLDVVVLDHILVAGSRAESLVEVQERRQRELHEQLRAARRARRRRSS
jgi:DNA repair protein RadC